MRMKADLEQDAEGEEEAQKPVPAADGSLRPRDKYGLASASVVAGTVRTLCVVLTWVACAGNSGGGQDVSTRVQAPLQGMGGDGESRVRGDS